MSWINYDDVRGQLMAAGLVIEELDIGTLRPKRVKVDGQRERKGWYWLHEISLPEGDLLIVGSYGIWSGNDNGAVKVRIPKSNRERLTHEQLEAIRLRQADARKRAEAERQREIEAASRRAEKWWAACGETGESAYLTRKHLARLYGARISPDKNLVVPISDQTGRIWGLQVIYSDPKVRERKGRDKDYAPPGLAKHGHWFQMGAPSSGAGGVLLVAEGFATAASLREATDFPVAVAFDANNLLPVVQALHKHYPSARILVCADDDYLQKCAACGKHTTVETGLCTQCGAPHGKANTGASCAEAAALAVGGAWIKPIFPSARPLDRKGPTDFNDLHADPAGGLSAVRSQIEARLTVWGVLDKATAAARSTGGAGDASERKLKGLLSIEEAVGRYALIYGGKGTFFDHQERELVPKGDVLDILPDRCWTEWKAHPKRQVVRMREVGFDPTETDKSITCNLWGGWPTAPKEGSCELLLDLLRFLCSGEANSRDLYAWVLNWLAYPIQHPGAKMKTALIFHGPQGAGKNMFFEAVMAIYGQYGRVVDQAALEDKFNDWASKRLFMIGDEVVARQELFHTKNKMKGFITGDTIRINPKMVAAHEERNHVNIVFLSNETQPLVLEKGDRRYAVIWTPERASPLLYTEIQAEINDGGVEALHDFLLKRDLTGFYPHTLPPMTEAKRDLITLSLDSAERFVDEWIDGDTGHPFCPCGSMDLYQAYLRWCRINGVSRPRESNQFLNRVSKLPGWACVQKRRYEDANWNGGMVKQRFVIPPITALEGSKHAWPVGGDKTETQWLTDGYFAFINSLERTERAAA